MVQLTEDTASFSFPTWKKKKEKNRNTLLICIAVEEFQRKKASTLTSATSAVIGQGVIVSN